MHKQLSGVHCPLMQDWPTAAMPKHVPPHLLRPIRRSLETLEIPKGVSPSGVVSVYAFQQSDLSRSASHHWCGAAVPWQCGALTQGWRQSARQKVRETSSQKHRNVRLPAGKQRRKGDVPEQHQLQRSIKQEHRDKTVQNCV